MENPKQAFGDKKVPLHLIPTAAQVYEALAYKSGALKYGIDNYRSSANKVEAMTYVGGARRHIEQWVSGEEVDRKELVHHLGAARASLGIIIAALEHGTLIDNRPPPVSMELFEKAEAVVEHLNKLYGSKDASTGISNGSDGSVERGEGERNQRPAGGSAGYGELLPRPDTVQGSDGAPAAGEPATTLQDVARGVRGASRMIDAFGAPSFCEGQHRPHSTLGGLTYCADCGVFLK